MSGVPSIASTFGHTIQALAPDGGTNKIDLSGSSQSVVLPAGNVLEISASQTCWIAFGDNTVTASKPAGGPQTGTSILFIQGTSVYLRPPKATYIAAILDGSTAGALTVTGMGTQNQGL